VISYPRALVIIATLLTFGISGCSEARRVRPQAKASPAPVDRNPNEAESATGDDFENATEAPTREELREKIRAEKATDKVLESLPEGDVSAEEIENLVKQAEAEITDEQIEAELPPAPVVEDTPLAEPTAQASPSPAPKSGGLLTDNTKPEDRPVVTPVEKQKEVQPPTTPDPSPRPRPSPSPAPEKKIETPPAMNPEPKVPAKTNPPVTKTPPKTKPIATPPVKKPVPTTPIKKPEPTVPETEPETTTGPIDDGIDEEDRQFADTYDGPKSIIHYPTSTRDYQLSEISAKFGMIRDKQTEKNKKSWAKISKDYLKIQIDYTKLSLPSCNFFFPAALIEAGAPATDGKPATRSHFPLIKAAQYETAYFNAKNSDWVQLKAKDGKSPGEILKEWFLDHRSFDVAIQRDAPKGKAHGHIAVPVGLNDKNLVMVAQASYKTVSNQIVPYCDNQLAKFRIFVRYDKNDPKFK